MTEPTPRTDREVYTTTARDIGFQAVNAALCSTIERELTVLRQRLAGAYEECAKVCDELEAKFKHRDYDLSEGARQCAHAIRSLTAFADPATVTDADDVDDLLAELEATQQELGKWITRCLRLQAELDARDKAAEGLLY